MRRYWVVALAVLALLGVLSPPAFAQAPTPQVTITGFIDTVSSLGQNIYDGNFTRTGDNEWYARVRFRPDLIGQVGSAKVVMGLEIDTAWGQVAAADTAALTAGEVGQRFATTSGFDLNTDTLGSIEMKWLYTEFPFTGAGSLLPFVPIPTVARVGAQPFATTYKGGVLASGDFAGVNLVTTWTPAIKTHLAYVQVEEDASSRGPMTAVTTSRGNDWAFIASLDFTVMKGLDIRPIYAHFNAEGITSGSARFGAGALPTTTFNADEERRHTIGFDSRWTWGNLFIDPTYFYQFGSREVRCASPSFVVAAATCISDAQLRGVRRGRVTADISAHFFDIRGGYRWGPLLLEAMVAMSSGNKGRDNLAKEIRYYAPINTDSTYYGGWANILALGTDYFNGAVNNLGAGISYFQYGRIQTGYRATYSWTPALDTYIYVSPTWTAREVDRDTPAATRAKGCVGNGLGGVPCNFEGDSSYIGTEVNLGLVWKFAPGLAFDLVGAYLFAGNALNGAEVIGPQSGATGRRIDAEDGYTIASRVRFSF